MNTKKNIVNSPFYNLTQFHIVKKQKKLMKKTCWSRGEISNIYRLVCICG